MLNNLSIGTFVASLPEGLEWLVTKVAETERPELKDDGRVAFKVNKQTEIHLEKGLGYMLVCVSFLHEEIVCTFTKAIEEGNASYDSFLFCYMKHAYLPN